ncbi:MAG: DNA mismatch repair protein MutS [Oscillospiraceae bacterium]|nr:DNA mismatch repair protein MutS [Oscillospiraceae bacterium]
MPANSPMMRQYNKMKAENGDALLFFRLGDFYEMFGDDAVTASRELDLTLTTRDRAEEDPDNRVMMCGVPYHSSEAYIARLVAKGYRVAICEQLEDPKDSKGGLVDRGVIRVVTPGTVTESSMLDEGRANNLAAVFFQNGSAAIAYADISTGQAGVIALDEAPYARVKSELAAVAPREVLLGGSIADDEPFAAALRDSLSAAVESRSELFRDDAAGAAILRHGEFAEEAHRLAPNVRRAAGALLGFLEETQKAALGKISFGFSSASEFMQLGASAIAGLELVQSNAGGDKKGSLLWAIDRTVTAMGRRLLRSQLLRPLQSPARIIRRLAAVEELTQEAVARAELRRILRSVGDTERLCGKIVFGTANARDVLALGLSLDAAAELREVFANPKSAELAEIAALDALSDVRDTIRESVSPEPPAGLREGGIMRDGFSAEVDRLRGLIHGGGGAVAALEARERERTGLKLKVGYNRVFGYYIELPRSKSDDVPADYIRRQTLATAERFITEELKKLESEILSAKDRVCEIEYALFRELTEKITAASRRIYDSAQGAARLDVFCSLAETAVRHNYVRPEINADGVLDIRDGRHAVVEQMQSASHFVPNDTYLDGKSRAAMIITGPNMAGKSTYMRQTALIVLLAHVGSFVPAASANVCVTDRIFTRIGAGDDLAGGKSTFMVEMTEAAEILRNATKNSLLVLDEIGRGTSTYDGVAIARAILEYCADRKKLGAKTLFSTHYHELAAAEGEVPGVVCCAMTAKRRGGDVIFLRKVTPGASGDSYGIDVAGLAGLPESGLKRANTVMEDLAAAPAAPHAVSGGEPQLTLGGASGDEVAEELRKTDLNTLTPIEALNLLYKLKKVADGG